MKFAIHDLSSSIKWRCWLWDKLWLPIPNASSSYRWPPSPSRLCASSPRGESYDHPRQWGVHWNYLRIHPKVLRHPLRKATVSASLTLTIYNCVHFATHQQSWGPTIPIATSHSCVQRIVRRHQLWPILWAAGSQLAHSHRSRRWSCWLRRQFDLRPNFPWCWGLWAFTLSLASLYWKRIGLTVNVIKPATATATSKLPVLVVSLPYSSHLVSDIKMIFLTVDIWRSVDHKKVLTFPDLRFI